MLASEIAKSKSDLPESALLEIGVDRAQRRVVVHQRHAQRVGVVLAGSSIVVAGRCIGDPDRVALLRRPSRSATC